MNKKYIRILAEVAIVASAAGMMTSCVNKRNEDVSSSRTDIVITTDNETTADETTTCEIIADSSSNIESSSSLNESSLNDSSEYSSNNSETSNSSSMEDTHNAEVEQTEVVYTEINSNQSNFEAITPEIGAETEYEIDVAVTDTAPVIDEQSEPELCEAVTENEYSVVAADYTPYDLYNQGRLYWGDYQYTWYSENVLPGYGLAIDGRHTDADGFVCDGDGYICVAASSLSKGTVVDTPFGRQGKVYDTGCDWGTIDVYVNW